MTNLGRYYDSGRYYYNNPNDSNHSRSWLSDQRVINHRLEWILKIAEKSKFVLKGTNDMTIRIPIEYLHSMGWEVGQEVQISNAWWDREDKCHKIQIQLTDLNPKGRGKWAK